MTQTPSRFIARDVPDVLNMLPALFGFAPADSFIMIAVEGDHRRCGFGLRMDMPAREHLDEAVQMISGHARRQEASGVILIALTDRAQEAEALMTSLRTELGPIALHEAIRADGGQYWVYDGLGVRGPIPYLQECSPLVVDAIVEGRQIMPDRESLVARFAPASGDRLKTMEAATQAAFAAVLGELAETPQADLGAMGMARLQPILERHSAGAPLSDIELATLAVWVSAASVRDEVWSRMRRDNAIRAASLWTSVAQCVIPPFEPPVLCLAAFAAWLCGDGAPALIAVERALEIQPDYSMAELIMRILQSGLSPEKWRGFSAGIPETS